MTYYDDKTQKLIAYVQDTLVADKAYINRDEFIYDGNLYRVTANIAQGTAIVLSGENANVILCGPVVNDSYLLFDEVKATIGDGDYFPFYDSSEFRRKKTLWSNIKAKLKPYFDPYYKTFATDYSNSSSYTKIKISINSDTYWMLSFMVTLYTNYRAIKLQISGYKYGNNLWYSPTAIVLGDSDPGNTAIKVYFGYDSTSALWVGLDCSWYPAIRIDQEVNSYYQVADKPNMFSFTFGTSLSGTIQTTVTARRPKYVN